MDDPVVGWLVIMEGPGKGAFRPLGYGMNSIGRSAESRVCLDFGDEQLSRSNHAVVVYDPRGRKFYVQHGGGINLTYVDNAPVMVPIELAAGQDMILGNTRLRFMPFCGAAFDWQDA
ncbi:MAG: FHA domain-containing protein [Magnetococcales bacterium]|nr:FHA domain-containing protein [Magnetococcales bacterium]